MYIFCTSRSAEIYIFCTFISNQIPLIYSFSVQRNIDIERNREPVGTNPLWPCTNQQAAQGTEDQGTEDQGTGQAG